MDNKQEMEQELNLDQMEKFSGGNDSDKNLNRERICPFFKQTIVFSHINVFVNHMNSCPNKPQHEATVLP